MGRSTAEQSLRGSGKLRFLPGHAMYSYRTRRLRQLKHVMVDKYLQLKVTTPRRPSALEYFANGAQAVILRVPMPVVILFLDIKPCVLRQPEGARLILHNQ